MFKMRYLLPLAALAAVLSYAVPSSAETIIDEWAQVKAPPPPKLESVALDPKTTAILMVDIIKQTVTSKDARGASLPFPRSKSYSRLPARAASP